MTVSEFLAALDHPHKPEIDALRRIILAVDPSVSEGVKWNAPSFQAPSVTGKDEWFATFHLRAQSGVQIILHRGARVREYDGKINDPAGLLTWLAPDRATVILADMADIEARGDALTVILRQWIAQL